jgi:hypothetical protein
MGGRTGTGNYTREERIKLCEANYRSMSLGALTSLGITGLYVGATIGTPLIFGVENHIFSLGPVLVGFLCAEAQYRIGQNNKNAANSIRARRANPLVELTKSLS